jgi:hypothetical protein
MAYGARWQKAQRADGGRTIVAGRTLASAARRTSAGQGIIAIIRNPSGNPMAFDPGLAQRIRERLAVRTGVTERRMFGGLAFLLDGHMAVGILGATLMARVGPAGHAAALAMPHARAMDFTGRPMKGYVYVDPPGIAEDADLAHWLDRCTAFVDTLPSKLAR